MTWGLLGLVALASPLLVPVPARAGRRRAEGGGAGLIEQWRRALVLAPHTDDGEFGCGGTMARLVERGCEVRYVAFSIATRSLPDGFPPDTLAREVREATTELGIPEEQLTVHDFDVRTFPEHRQDILEMLVALWEEWQPEVVFQPSLHDVHQDHKTIARGGPARVQAHDDPRLRDPVEQLRLRVPVVRRAREARTSRGRWPRSRSTRHSSTAATRIPSTCGTSRARTGST